MDKRAVRDAIAQALAGKRAVIERLRPLYPGKTDEMNTIKGVNEFGYPIMASATHLPRNHPMPMWCECGAAIPWIDLGVLEYKYPDRKWHVFICAACGKHVVNLPVLS